MSDTMQGPPAENFVAGPPDGPGRDNRRLLLVAGAVAAVVVLGAAVYFLFLSGGGSDAALGPVVVAGGTTSPAPSSTDGTTVPKPVKSNFKVGSDPFKTLAAEIPVTTSPSSDPTASSDTGGQTGGATTPAPTPTPTPSNTSTGSTSSFAVTLKSVNVSKGAAVIDVNGKRYNVNEGDIFPSATTGPFKLIRVDVANGGDVARVLYGSDLPVVLKLGHTVTFSTSS